MPRASEGCNTTAAGAAADSAPRIARQLDIRRLLDERQQLVAQKLAVVGAQGSVLLAGSDIEGWLVGRRLGLGEQRVDPSGDATELRLTLARLGARCAGILVTHGHFDHLLGVADLAEGTGAQVYMPDGERTLLEAPEGRYTPPGISVRAYAPDVLLEGHCTRVWP